MQIKLLTKKKIDKGFQKQIAKLYHQISAENKPLELSDILTNDNKITIAIGQDNTDVVGMALMCKYTVLSGKKAWIEDVVVDQNSRGKGVGRKLIERLISEAANLGVTEVLLFTSDHRKAAIKLYKNLGFKEKNSRIYRLILKDN